MTTVNPVAWLSGILPLWILWLRLSSKKPEKKDGKNGKKDK